MTQIIGRFLLPALAITAVACNSSGPSAGLGDTRLLLSVTTGGGPAAAPAGAPETIGLGSDVLVLNQVDVVLRKIQLKRLEVAGDCDSIAGMSRSNGSDDHGDANDDHGDEDCDEVEVGPMLVSLPLGGATTQQLEVPLAPGTYRRVRLEIHKPDDDHAEDLAFLTANPDFRRVSIRVRGTFNGTPFEFVSDLNAEQELTLSPPLVLAQDSTASVTLSIDVHGWFLDAAHGHLIDPATALKGQPNEGQVKQNIRTSIRADCDDHGEHN